MKNNMILILPIILVFTLILWYNFKKRRSCYKQVLLLQKQIELKNLEYINILFTIETILSNPLYSFYDNKPYRVFSINGKEETSIQAKLTKGLRKTTRVKGELFYKYSNNACDYFISKVGFILIIKLVTTENLSYNSFIAKLIEEADYCIPELEIQGGHITEG